MKFKSWFLYNELENPFTAESSDVVIEPYLNKNGDKGYKSDFISEDGRHRVTFIEKPSPNYPNLKCYDINLSDPTGGYELTGKSKNPNLVYSNLLKIVVEFIKKFNPPLLSFIASDPNMEPVYKRFYERYMKDLYPLVQYGLFMRKDLYEKHKHLIDKQKITQTEKNWQAIADEAKESKREIQRFYKILPELQLKLIRKFIKLDPAKIAHTGFVEKDFGRKPITVIPTRIKVEDEFVVMGFYFINKRKLDFAKVYFTIPTFMSAIKQATPKDQMAFGKLNQDEKARLGQITNELANVQQLKQGVS